MREADTIIVQLNFTRHSRHYENMLIGRSCYSRHLLAVVVLLFSLTLSPPVTRCEPKLPHLFSDHMVFQQGMNISVWGWADAGEEIEVRLGSNVQKTSTEGDGRWRVLLPATGAGGPFSLQVRGKKTLVIKDVLIGEVWVASGQSNMTFALEGATGGEEEIRKAHYSQLRLFTVPRRIALDSQTDTLPAAWELCTPETVKTFSAVAYFFARNVQEKLGVPVGIIESAWPGTAAEEWTDSASLRNDPVLQPIMSRWNASSTDEKSFAAHARNFSLEFDDFELLPAKDDAAPLSLGNFDDGTSRVSTGGAWEYSWRDGRDSQFELVQPGRGNKGYSARISGVLDGASDSRWQLKLRSDGSPVDLSSYAGLRFWVRGNGSFNFYSLQPSISDWDDYGAGIVKATPGWKEVTIWFKDLKQDGWGVSEKLTLNQISGFVISSLTDLSDPPRPPSGLYEGMISPLTEYRIRGAIWYQGESNTERAYQYRFLLPALIRGWRAAWREPEFSFLIVQLPNQGHTEEFADSWWAELREAQLLTVKGMPNAGLAVTIDVGEAGNLHPPRKKEIGERLAGWALGTTYGKKIVFSGPLYDGIRVEGKQIRVHFKYGENGLKAQGKTLRGFTIAGSDKKFHRATASIDGQTVLVSSPEVQAPIAVRYAWGDSPECSLFNDAGLPASPFRSDDWPGATFSNR
jgi:sialate O-acetylesterase